MLAVDYKTSLVQFTGTVETLKLRSRRFSSQLKAAGIGDRPVIFICHSMGKLCDSKQGLKPVI